MSSLSRELVFLILQFLDEEKFKETVHKLEQESGFYFNMRYFEEEVQSGNWDEVERYLSGFTKVDDNRYSMKIFFEIRKQKYLEALDKHDRSKAVDILMKDLKVFSTFNEELFKEITNLMTLDNFRENEQLSKYGDTKSARGIMLVELKKLIEANPLFRDKLLFPSLRNSRLRTLINQSLNWQHQLCKNPRPNPDIKTLFVDHSCGPQNGTRAPSPVNNPLLGSLPKPGGFPPLGAHGPFQPMPSTVPTPLAGWMSGPSTVPHHPAVSGGFIALGSPSIPASLKHPRTPTTNSSVDYPSGDSDHVSKRTRSMGISDEVNLGVNMLPMTFPGQAPVHTPAFKASEDLPKTVARSLSHGSCPMSMDFHPLRQTLLLVGTNVGDIGLWEVGSRERLVHKTFKVWDLSKCSMPLQAALVKDPAVSVNRVVWSPDGSLFGVAYSRHIVQIYSYQGGDDMRQHLEMDAHAGGVNDIAFSTPNKQLCVITCGDDKTIKVWDATTGAKRYMFEGHEAPVYSICPHYKETIQFIFSTALDGKIKAWLYDNMGSRVDYDAPGRWCTTMSYSADGTRLFSCGTSKEGESYIVEWNESEGAVKRTYQGFNKRSLGVVQFDTTKNRYLAAGDDFSIKFWDMDSVQLLTAIDADGGLQASPRIRFNKEGSLLAVSANENVIKILANSDGLRLLQTFEKSSAESSKAAINSIAATTAATTSAVLTERSASVVSIPGMVRENGESRNMVDMNPMNVEESNDKSKKFKLTEINEPSQCRSLRLPENLRVTKISRLIFTNSGNAILALSSNAIHLLWRWQRSEHNTTGKATASVPPLQWQPPSGNLMTNVVSETNPEEAVPCFALSKNDSYVMSASGGKISLFNMMTFKTMATFMPPPPAATFLAFHPQDNNIIAIGMDDNTIQIYNVRVDEVKSKLRGHSKRITGLAFSNVLNVLVSSGADSQICVWNTDGWEKQKSKVLQLPLGRTVATAPSDTCVQFHQDHVHFLVVHETQLAIYETTKLECVKQWVVSESSAPITHATFSCDSQLIYASFKDATVCVFTSSNLRLRCRVNPSAYLPSNLSNSNVHPVVIAAHPQEPNMFAEGLSDGGVHIFEPLESEGGWGVAPPAENGSDQPQR
ncbi:PREDICTED: protein TOPLESS-like [Tarenaya hassleriana]|uniref:protein TOPLESS-like n=1 Tax=Tarenaya hassleriana TaxID=28532 RepID=UPI00053C666F|nr:PREDICTED: protein TOPLESS-like [Tarenaya hassleriana]XP_010539523.1 PREDICTED: protein TOPLESS-like [Tarenaya hassleriana]XP_010539524.1 PREDICTED: protein TOPLESS-like [Tarenaya hassleriana]